MKLSPSVLHVSVATSVFEVFFLATIVTVGTTVSIVVTTLEHVPTLPATSFIHALYVPLAFILFVVIVPYPLVALVHEYGSAISSLPPVSLPETVKVADVAHPVGLIDIEHVGGSTSTFAKYDDTSLFLFVSSFTALNLI